MNRKRQIPKQYNSSSKKMKQADKMSLTQMVLTTEEKKTQKRVANRSYDFKNHIDRIKIECAQNYKSSELRIDCVKTYETIFSIAISDGTQSVYAIDQLKKRIDKYLEDEKATFPNGALNITHVQTIIQFLDTSDQPIPQISKNIRTYLKKYKNIIFSMIDDGELISQIIGMITSLKNTVIKKFDIKIIPVAPFDQLTIQKKIVQSIVEISNRLINILSNDLITLHRNSMTLLREWMYRFKTSIFTFTEFKNSSIKSSYNFLHNISLISDLINQRFEKDTNSKQEILDILNMDIYQELVKRQQKQDAVININHLHTQSNTHDTGRWLWNPKKTNVIKDSTRNELHLDGIRSFTLVANVSKVAQDNIFRNIYIIGETHGLKTCKNIPDSIHYPHFYKYLLNLTSRPYIDMYIETCPKRTLRNIQTHMSNLRNLTGTCVDSKIAIRQYCTFSNVRVHWTDTRDYTKYKMVSPHEAFLCELYIEKKWSTWRSRKDIKTKCGEDGIVMSIIVKTLQLYLQIFTKNKANFEKKWSEMWEMIMSKHKLFKTKMTWLYKADNDKEDEDEEEEEEKEHNNEKDKEQEKEDNDEEEDDGYEYPYNEYGYNHHIFDIIKNYYGVKIFNEGVKNLKVWRKKYPRFLSHRQITRFLSMSDDKKFTDKQRDHIDLASKVYLKNTWKLYTDTYTIMRIFKKYNTDNVNRQFTRNIILHHGNNHSKIYRGILEKLGMGPSVEIGTQISKHCYKIDSQSEDGNISLFGKHI